MALRNTSGGEGGGSLTAAGGGPPWDCSSLLKPPGITDKCSIVYHN